MPERIDTKAVLADCLPPNPANYKSDFLCTTKALLQLEIVRAALAQEIADREALEMERDEWEAAVRYLHGHYPEDVFPPNSNTPDAKAGTFARRLLGWLLDPVERTRLAALRGEEET